MAGHGPQQKQQNQRQQKRDNERLNTRRDIIGINRWTRRGLFVLRQDNRAAEVSGPQVQLHGTSIPRIPAHRSSSGLWVSTRASASSNSSVRQTLFPNSRGRSDERRVR